MTRLFKLPVFVKLLRKKFISKLKHDLWARDEIIIIFNDAILEAHMEQLEEYEITLTDD